MSISKLKKMENGSGHDAPLKCHQQNFHEIFLNVSGIQGVAVKYQF